MRRFIQMAVVTGVTVVLMVAFVRNADFTKIIEEVAAADVSWLALAAVASSTAYVLRAKRWQFLLRPVGPTHFGAAFKATAIGFAASFILPGRTGEVLRPYVLARREGLNAIALFASIAVERVLDMIAVLLLFAAFLLWTDPTRWLGDQQAAFGLVRMSGITATALSLVGVGVLVAMARDPDRIRRIIDRLGAVLPVRVVDKVAALFCQLAPGFAILRRPSDAAVALLGAMPLWFCSLLAIWCVSNALHLGIPMEGTCLMLMLLVIGVAAPTPGGLGSFHYAFRLGATTFFAVAENRAIGAAIILHAITFFPVAIAGLILAAHEGFAFTEWRIRARAPGGELGAVVDLAEPRTAAAATSASHR